MIQPALLKPLARLALPTVAVMFLLTALSVTETYFVSSLGTEAVAAASLVVPAALLVTMISNGGIGGGVSSAIARARGAGDQVAAESLLWHAVVLGVAFGVLTTALAWIFGPAIYHALGGRGVALSSALAYSNVLFSGAAASWTLTLIQASLRGAGNVKMPALTIAGSVFAGLALSPVLIAGAFGWPGLGVMGAGVAQIATNLGGLFVLLVYIRRPAATLRLKVQRLSRYQFGEILGVGLPSSLNALLSAVAFTAATAAAGAYGASEIAGYGIASRLDTLLIPVLFGFGTAAVTLTGMSIGAGDVRRARAIALTNASFVATATGVLGIVLAISPQLWLSIFTSDPAVIRAGSAYMKIVAPTFALSAIAMELYFAGQGASRIFWPVVATIVRAAIAILAVALVRTHAIELRGGYLMIAAGVAMAAAITVTGFWRTSWERESIS